MSNTQVHSRTWFDVLLVNLSDLIALPNPEAAEAMNSRMSIFEQVEKIHERSYVERGIIIRQFETRQLWQYLTDPDTGQAFPNLTAWLSCGSFLGCRRTNFEAKRDVTLLADVPDRQLIDVPKANLKVLVQLSTAVRSDPEVLEAARTMPREAFEEKIEREQPHQHIERRLPLRFNPGRTGARVIEEAIAWALEHDIAGTRDEALIRAAETALNEWKLEDELRSMPAD